MKKTLKYLAFLAPGLFVLTGCENPTVEETLPYYYTENIVYLSQNLSSFTFAHTPNGIQNKDVPFTVKLNKASDKACSVVVEIETEGIDASDITLVDGNTLTIPAGATSVSSALRFDWSAATDARIVGTVKLTIKSADVYISEENNVLELAICKATKTNVHQPSGDSPAGTELDNRSEWTVKVWSNSEFSGDGQTTISLTDGNYWSYDYTGSDLGIEIDLGAEHTITGIKSFSSFGSSYAPTQATILTSTDGENWTIQGENVELEAMSTTNIELFEPATARYIRLALDSSNGALSSELYVYTE